MLPTPEAPPASSRTDASGQEGGTDNIWRQRKGTLETTRKRATSWPPTPSIYVSSIFEAMRQITLYSCFTLFIDLTNLLLIVNSFRGSRILRSSRFNLTEFRMLPDLTVNNELFGLVILFNGNFHSILCRQNIGRSSRFCPLLTPPQPWWPPCCSSYMPDPLALQGLCTCCSLCLECSFFHGLPLGPL